MKKITLLLALAFVLSACNGDSEKPSAQVAASDTHSAIYIGSAQAVIDKYKQDYQVSLSNKGVVIFDKPEQLFEAMNDYPAESNRFEKIGDNPLRIRLSYQTVSTADFDTLQNEAEMTLLYGILKTFAHTGVDKVAVQSISLDENGKFLKKSAISLAAEREKTLKALQKLGLADNFDSLVETGPNNKFRYVGLSGSDIYDSIVYKDDKRKALLAALK